MTEDVAKPYCGAGEETREQTAEEVAAGADHNKDKRKHVLPSFGKDYHTLCYGERCEGSKDEQGLTRPEREYLATLPAEARYLVEKHVAFVGYAHQEDDGYDGRLLVLNMNDTFGYACADVEVVTKEQLSEVTQIYRKYGTVGLTCWAAKQRGMDPVIEYTEDPVYQRTWQALYGDLKVGINGQLMPNLDGKGPFGPTYRWSQRKLNLQEWTPLPEPEVGV